MASKNNKVALVVGASRGIGRQVAVDLAKNGYAGKEPRAVKLNISDRFPSCRSSQIYLRRVCHEAISTRSELSPIHNQHRLP